MLDATLDDYVLNEMVVAQPRHVQNLMIALSTFPRLSNDLVQELLASLGGAEGDSFAIFHQLPCFGERGADRDTNDVQLPPQVRLSLRRLGRVVGDQSVVQDLQRLGVCWFIRQGDYDAARSLALESGIAGHYVDLIHPHCAMLAAGEHWSAIRDILADIPIDELDRSADLTFWRMLGESYSGNMNELSIMLGAIHASWRVSDDPLRRGRAELMVAWGHWGKSQPECTLEHAETSLTLLPVDAVQDRMFATIAAENAARNIGDPDLVHTWATRTSKTSPVAAMRLEWWHVNCGYHRLSHLAQTGRLSQAYHLAAMTLGQVNRAYPRAAFRYPILQATIDLEARWTEQAHEHVLNAQRLSNGIVTELQLEMLIAQVALANQEFSLARDTLHIDESSDHIRPDRYVQRMRILAEIELAAGDPELAYDIVTNWCNGDESWPKYFGEPHHHLVKAKILAQRGLVQEAIASAQQVINEARRRNHLFYLVSALAIQAECHARIGREERLIVALAMIRKCVGTESYAASLAPFGRDVRLLTAEQGEEEPQSPPSVLPVSAIRISELTKREVELLRVAAAGASAREIAESLYISPSTVKNHMTSIYRKLGVSSRREAIDMVFPEERGPKA